MNTFQIETAQNITIQQNLAPISTRIGSYLLDVLILVLYIFLIVFIVSTFRIKDDLTIGVLITLLMLPVFFYSLVFEVLCNGQTPGKMINHIRVVKLDGSKPTLANYLLRWMLRIVDFNIANGAVAVLTILLNGKGQRVGDIAAGTTVISERKKITLNTLGTYIEDNYQPSFPQVTTLNDTDISTIRELFFKAKQKQNHKIILKLHQKIEEITQIKTDKKPIDFIETVLKDYHYYTKE